MSTDEMEPQNPTDEKEEEDDDSEDETESSSSSSSSSSSDSESDSDSDSEPLTYVRPDGKVEQIDPYASDFENTPEVNIARFSKVLNSKRRRREEEEEEEDMVHDDDLFDFPPDPENWQEEDLKELWGDAPLRATKPGWDPYDVDPEELDDLADDIIDGADPPIAPFYVPYRKFYPAIPVDNYDVSNPKSVIEELDRIEEFLIWVSYIFPNGTTYEGTVWDDLAHGKGVYVAEQGLVRYEGEWLQNQMDGHGVVEVEIPQMEPIPGSKLEAQMRAEGKIISRDYMPPEDREWLEMDIEDSLKLAKTSDEGFEIPFYENDLWVKVFGSKPEKGRYRYAGQWKHGRMHGCGVYEVNERTTFGRFYFGELLDDSFGCDAEISAMHSGLAEVAAAKARMFINKPDGMVREDRGPYSDPQHPYLYEEEDVWMAPGFINQFYEVPDYWKMYVHEVDEEREMWLNSFYRAPLRLPMPPELEYWWANDETPEFVLINKEPEPDPQDPSKLIYTEDPLILHTPTGRIINYVDDEEYGVRLFWQPKVEEGEEPNLDDVEFLPIEHDKFFGRETVVEKDSFWISLVKSMENACKPWLAKLDKWIEEKKKAGEIRKELYKKELELIEAELTLKEAVEDLDEQLKILQKEEENKLEQGIEDEEDASVSEPVKQTTDQAPMPEAEEDEGEEEEEDEEDTTASSFGSIEAGNSKNNDQNGSNGKTKFASASLSFGTFNLISLVPQKLHHPFLRWKESKFEKGVASPSSTHACHEFETQCRTSVSFPVIEKSLRMKCGGRQSQQHVQCMPKLRNQLKTKSSSTEWREDLGVLSLHTPITM